MSQPTKQTLAGRMGSRLYRPDSHDNSGGAINAWAAGLEGRLDVIVRAEEALREGKRTRAALELARLGMVGAEVVLYGAAIAPGFVLDAADRATHFVRHAAEEYRFEEAQLAGEESPLAPEA